VSKGALYFHFASKDELVAAVRQEARQSVLTLAGECLDGRSSTLAGAARFTVAVSRRMREDPILRAGLRLESEGVADESTGGPSLREGWLALLRERLAADAAAGRLREDTDAEATANLIAAVTVGLESLGRENENWWDPHVTTGIWQLLLTLADADDETAAQVWTTLRELRDCAEQQSAESTAPARTEAAVLRLPTHAAETDRVPLLARASSYDGRC
jgi:AcrR family transcriptional regulator